MVGHRRRPLAEIADDARAVGRATSAAIRASSMIVAWVKRWMIVRPSASAATCAITSASVRRTIVD
jgi:hypothetical protein